MDDDKPPAWKFWHPLPFWHVIVVLLITNVVAALLIVGLREGLGLTGVPTATSGGVGGFLGFVIIYQRAAKARATSNA